MKVNISDVTIVYLRMCQVPVNDSSAMVQMLMFPVAQWQWQHIDTMSIQTWLARGVFLMNKVVLSGYYGFNNAGDEAVLQAIINSLKSRRI